jgi:hypothetical protein
MKENKAEILNEDYIDKTIPDKVEFFDTLFHEKFGFTCVGEFSSDVIFFKCVFNKNMLIYSCDFSRDLIFNQCVFNGHTNFSVLDIKGKLVFKNCIFLEEFKFIDSTIHGNSIFTKCVFTKGINLFSHDKESFGNIAFEGGLNIFG